MDFSQNKKLSNLKPYIPGQSIEEIAKKYSLFANNIVKLNSNENPFGCFEQMEGTIRGIIPKINVNHYPAALSDNLSEKIKSTFPVIGDGEVIIGNGMDNILEGIARMLLGPGDRVIIHSPTFSYYELVSRWAGAAVGSLKCTPETGFAVDAEKIIRNITPEVKVIFLCSPNNPTGTVIPKEEILLIVEAARTNNTVVFLDEAYIEYAEVDSLISEVSKHPNLIVGRTFSKVYGLAAMRVGWAVAHSTFVKEYRKVQTPFSVNTLGQMVAMSALDDQAFIEESVRANAKGREYLTTEIQKLGLKVYPGKANFVLVESPIPAADMCEKLLKEGIMVRNVTQSFRIEGEYIRITIGNELQNQRAVFAMYKAIK